MQESGKQCNPQFVDSSKKKMHKMIEAKNMISAELEGIHDLDFTPAPAVAGFDGPRTRPAKIGELV